MPVEGLFVIAAVVAGIFLLASSRSARRPDAPPAPPAPTAPPVPGVPYRVPGSGPEDEGRDELDDRTSGEEWIEPRDRRRLGALWLAYEACRERYDGEGMLEIGRAAADDACEPVRHLALHVLAHGQALSDAESDAVLTLERARGSGTRLYGIQIEVYRLARRYRRAHEVLLRALEEDADPALAATAQRLEDESPRWDHAVRRLSAPAELEPAEDYWLVREAGRLKGRNDDAARVGERLFETEADPDLAWAIARCWARAKDRDRTVAWLLRAAEAGSRHAERLDATPELALLRGTEAHGRVSAALAGASESSPPAIER